MLLPHAVRPNVVAAVSSADGEHLLRAAWKRADLLGADLTICTAIAQSDGRTLLEVEALAERILATAPRDAMIRFDVRPGAAGAQILACARELDAAQIIVGQAARGTKVRLAHTGVCNALLHDAACPVLVAGPRRGSRRILVATELADPGAQVLRAAAVEAGRDGSAVTALHCLPSDGAADDERTAAAHARLVERLDELELAAEPRIALAPIARSIVETAAAVEADLIVMGSHAHCTAEQVAMARRHARPGIGRLMSGSVAERVMREAPCSVLLVPVADPLTPA